MSNWSPKPLRPKDPNPLFDMSDETYVVKSMNAMEHQRAADGTPHTKLRPSSVSPRGERIYIDQDEPVAKSSEAEKPSLDPDAVVKSFLAKGVSDDAEEDEQKGMGESVGNAVGGAIKTGANAVTSGVQKVNSAK